MALVLVNGKLLGETTLPFKELRKLARAQGWRYQSWEEGALLDIETQDTQVLQKIRYLLIYRAVVGGK
ncbi:U exon protein [bat adenovirus 3]|uniref:U exon protein n=2 Tax=Bat mastadenovirus A TaxID=1146877 RepID=D3X7D0_9ADEN|nr:U exon protein [bat adenovirus 3]ADD17119.1 U exon protein [bat adenovirus 3]BBE29351.1 U exon [Bat mastadenovirus A]